MIISSSRATLAVACAIAVSAASSASAATLSGTVVGQPKTAHGRAVVPVLLSSAGSRAAGGAVAKVSVPVKRGLRANAGSISASGLRIGDRVTASVRRVALSDRASILRIHKRGATPSFGALAKDRAAAATAVAQASQAVDQIKANPMTLLDPSKPAGSTEALRAQLEGVRSGLNSLIAAMRRNADGIVTAVAVIENGRPKDAARRAAVARQQSSLVTSLTASATAARDGAAQLEQSTTQLDQAINDLGGASSPSIGINEVGTVSDVLHAVLELLRGP